MEEERFRVTQNDREECVECILKAYPQALTPKAVKCIAKAMGFSEYFKKSQMYVFLKLDGSGFEWFYGIDKEACLNRFLNLVYSNHPPKITSKIFCIRHDISRPYNIEDMEKDIFEKFS